MRQWILRVALVALGAALGVFVAPQQWQAALQGQVSSVTTEASTRAALWLASQSDLVDARASLFVEFPGILAAIQRGGAFGGAFSRAIATDIFKASDEGIAGARKLSRIEAVGPRT